MTSAEIRAAVQQSVNLESAHDRHNCPPVRQVRCVVCEEPGSRGSMCDGCKALWLEGRPAA